MWFGKRIDQPGGHRRAVREEAMVRAAMMTTTDTFGVDLLDISKSGVRLRSSNLPLPGQEVVVLIGRLEAFGTIVWRDEDQCGVQFDAALSDDALAIVESERSPFLRSGLGGEEQLAAGDWNNGLAR